MASYKRLLKLKTRIKAQKTVIKQLEQDLEEHQSYGEQYLEEAKQNRAEITRLEGIVGELMPDGTVGGRIQELTKSKARMQDKVLYLDSELAAKAERVKELEEKYRTLQVERDELRQENSKLHQDLEHAGVQGRKAADREWLMRLNLEKSTFEERVADLERRLALAYGGQQQRDQDLEDVIDRLKTKPEPEPAAAGAKAGVTAVADFATSVAAGIRRIRENFEDADDKGYIEFLEEKIKEKDRRIENMIGELNILYNSKFDSLDETSPAKQINELAEVLMHEFGSFFDRSEGAVDMAIRLLRGFKKT